MKTKILITTFFVILLLSCKDNVKTEINYEYHYKEGNDKPIIVDTIEYIKIVKSTKEENQTRTSYKYTYDILNGGFKKVPEVYSEIKYYIIYNDGTIEETNNEKYMFYEKGDTVKFYNYIYK